MRVTLWFFAIAALGAGCASGTSTQATGLAGFTGLPEGAADDATAPDGSGVSPDEASVPEASVPESSGYADDASGGDGATCSADHCVGATAEAGSDAGNSCPADPLWTGACPSVCTGGCISNTCVIDCASGSACSGAIYCPGQLACKVACSATESCQNVTLYCSSAASCSIDCSGASSCVGSTLYCGSKACTASCTGTDAKMGSKYCGSSCACTTGGC